MDQYKHSCPHCGQHMEYTREYCGKNMSCPSCGKLVMFPAIPPGGFKKHLRIARPGQAGKEKLGFKFGPMLKKAFVLAQEFEHWQVVGFCLIPFVVIAVGLLAARELRKHQASAPASTQGPAHGPVDAGTWDRMEALARVDQQMQAYVQTVWSAKARVDAAARSRDELHNMYRGQLSGPIIERFQAADREINYAQQSYGATKQGFQRAYSNYQNMGGKGDYQSQLPP